MDLEQIRRKIELDVLDERDRLVLDDFERWDSGLSEIIEKNSLEAFLRRNYLEPGESPSGVMQDYLNFLLEVVIEIRTIKGHSIDPEEYPNLTPNPERMNDAREHVLSYLRDGLKTYSEYLKDRLRINDHDGTSDGLDSQQVIDFLVAPGTRAYALDSVVKMINQTTHEWTESELKENLDLLSKLFHTACWLVQPIFAKSREWYLLDQSSE